MKKYNEYTPTEIGTSKTAWNWFPCQLEPNGAIHYSNGCVLTTKPPVRNWPNEAPDSHMLQGKRRAAFEKPYDASSRFRAFYADNWPTLAVTEKTERISRINRNDYKPGYVTLRRDDTETAIGRHYYALFVKMYGDRLEFRHERPRTAVQVRRSGKTVALIMPIRR